MVVKKAKTSEEACSCNECRCGSGCCWCKVLVLLLAAVGCIAAIMACIYACKSYKLNVLSAGWEENLQKMIDLYKSPDFVKYMTDQTDNSVKSFMDNYGTTSASDETWNDVDVENENVADDTDEVEDRGPEGTLALDEVASLKEKGVIYGPENAKITILEFADASCGYCKRQIWQDKTVDAVMEQYPDDVNVIFKNFPIFNETAAQAMACSQDELTAENYHNYVVAVFQADDATSVDALAELAATFWADKTKIADCVNNGDKAQEVQDTMAEWQSFGITWTPSSVIINNESGEFSLVPGAYPVETFVEAIQKFLS